MSEEDSQNLSADMPTNPLSEPVDSASAEIPVTSPSDDNVKPAGDAADLPADGAPVTIPTSQDGAAVEPAPLNNNQPDAGSEPASLPTQPSVGQTSQPTAPQTSPASFVASRFAEGMHNWKQHLLEALAKKQQRKQEEQIQVLALAEKHNGSVTNKQVQTALRCTELTAYRYLSSLEKQGKLKRVGGHNTPKYELVK